MYGRIYNVPFTAISVSAAPQDLIYLKAASDKPIVIHKVVITVDNSETNQQFKISIKRVPATVTVGSGGASVTPVKTRTGDASASFTARRNDTTPATTSGTLEDFNPEGFPAQGGFEYLPDLHERVTMVSTEAFVVRLDEAPGSSIPMSGYAVVEELG